MASAVTACNTNLTLKDMGGAASSSRPKKYDVFVSFRGEDTRNNFTSHLHAALRRNKIKTYIDINLDKGDEVWPALVEAIQDSNVFLVIFSKNNASSTWCLNELIEIMKCKIKGQEVIPVFYRIDPSHVRKQKGSYRTALAKREQDFKHRDDKVHEWKAALYEAANLVGFDSRVGNRTESDLIEDIIKEVLQKLNHKYPHELRVPPILDQNYAHVESLLKIESSEVRIIGIWGMGGIGKTTIAAAVFQRVSSQYEGSCFLANLREESKRHGLNYLCSRLLSELLGEDLHMDTSKVISSIVMSRLRRKKVLIVLDDVNTLQLLENLVGELDWLGAGSRVIVTTRDKHVLSRGVDEIHHVKQMNFQDSLQLFSLNAFNENHPEKEYEELSKRAVVYANGIPLALKVLGSFLHSKSENEWHSELTKLKKFPNAEIQKVLRSSYDELDDTETNIFLDIACCFKGDNINDVTGLLNACGFFADIGIRNLLDKALITTTSLNWIEMHELIQAMGREIVCQESIKNPGGRSRLWDSEEVCHVLKNNRGSDAIESIFLDMTQITNLHLSSHAFRKMANLRLLNFCGGQIGKRSNSVYLPRGLGSLPNSLRFIRWDEYPLKSLPSTFCPEKLVRLSMRYSNVEKLWNGVQNLPNLEEIDFQGSTNLIEIPNLSRAPNLKCVDFGYCARLPHVHPSILSLPKLERLFLSGCKVLKSLCANDRLASLRSFSALECSSRRELSLPVTSDKIRSLNLGDTAINEVPPSILHLRHISFFHFHISESLKDLPENFARKLVLTDARQHERDALIALRTILPSSGFRYIKSLSLPLCRTLSEPPDNISLLSSLEELSLFKSRVISLPESIKYLPRLRHVDLRGCEKLQALPALPQSIQCLDAGFCKSLKTVLSSTSEPAKKHKCTFLFQNCIKLDHDALDTILKDALVRIQLGAKSLSAMAFEDAYADDDELQEDTYSDNNDNYCSERVESGKICYFFPAGSRKVRVRLHYCSTQALVTTELPPHSNFLGFVFYLVLSQVQSSAINDLEKLGCECSLETSNRGRVNITSLFAKFNHYIIATAFEIMSDHVFLWYDAQCCKQIMEAVKVSKSKAINDGGTTYNPKLKFKFFTRTKDYKEVVIKECGLRSIYPLEDQIVEEGGGCKSKRSREIHELEEPRPSAGQNGVEGSDDDEHKDEQEEPVPTPSNKEIQARVFELPPTWKLKKQRTRQE